MSDDTTTLPSSHFVVMERELSITDRRRLVEIAHEAGAGSDVRKWAIDTLERASLPAIVMKGTAP